MPHGYIIIMQVPFLKRALELLRKLVEAIRLHSRCTSSLRAKRPRAFAKNDAISIPVGGFDNIKPSQLKLSGLSGTSMCSL
ncbi:hypothetical protein CCP4SC76_7800004 [Gammaproteobacteria bacterium]